MTPALDLHPVRDVRGSCPSAADMDHTPRLLFALARAGLREEVLRSNTPWMCVSCYFCTVRCRRRSTSPTSCTRSSRSPPREGLAPDSTAPDFSRTFVSNIRRFGRSFEVGLVARHYLRHFLLRLAGIGSMGAAIVTPRADGVRSASDPGRRQPQAILTRADEIEAAGRDPEVPV